MKNQTYFEQLISARKQARKQKDAEAMVYYTENLENTSACVGFERFKSSWAYGEWIKRLDVQSKIKAIKQSFQIF